MKTSVKSRAAALCFLATWCTAWSQMLPPNPTPSPNRQVSGNGAQASFHLSGGSPGAGIASAIVVQIVFNDNAQTTGVSPALLLQVTETNASGQQMVFQTSGAPNFLYTETAATLNVNGSVTVTLQPGTAPPQTLPVIFQRDMEHRRSQSKAWAPRPAITSLIFITTRI